MDLLIYTIELWLNKNKKSDRDYGSLSGANILMLRNFIFSNNDRYLINCEFWMKRTMMGDAFLTT